MVSSGFDPQRDLLDMTGKVVLVTGANHGLGLATVKHLVLRGATVYLGARSEAKGLEAVASLERELAKEKEAEASSKKKAVATQPSVGKVVYQHCDLSTPAQAKESAEKFAEREDRLDVLINNAGVLADKAVMDQIMMVNHFGTFQFTQSLLPLLIKTSEKPNSDVRIVYVGSEAHKLTRAKNANIRFSTLADFNEDLSSDWVPQFSTYCVSKLTTILTAKALQRRLDGESHAITCMVVDPGSVNTFSHRLPLKRLLTPVVDVFFKSPAVGAYNSVFAAASPVVRQGEESAKYRGAYLIPVGKMGVVGGNVTEELQDEIWATTEKALRQWETEGFDEKNPYGTASASVV